MSGMIIASYWSGLLLLVPELGNGQPGSGRENFTSTGGSSHKEGVYYSNKNRHPQRGQFDWPTDLGSRPGQVYEKKGGEMGNR
jgi:hypothetical protein